MFCGTLVKFFVLSVFEQKNETLTSQKYPLQVQKHFKEMNSYLGMTMVKKEQGQDDFFSQPSILLTLPT